MVLDHENGEVVCQNCGLVVNQEKISNQNERAYDDEQRKKRARTGAPETFKLHDKGLSTVISPYNTDAWGRHLPAKSQAEMFRLRKWQKRSRVKNATERSMSIAMSRISLFAERLHMPSATTEKAAVIFHSIAEKGLVRGRSIDEMVAGVIYLACREHRVLRSLDEIEAATKVRRKVVCRAYRLLLKEVHRNEPVPQQTAYQYVSKITGSLRFPADKIPYVLQALKEAQKRKKLAGRDPKGMAAAALYIVSYNLELGVIQREIAKAAGVTEVTVRNRYKELEREIGDSWKSLS